MYPSLYQINTRVLLNEIGRGLGRRATLDDVPDSLLDRVAGLGFDWVWLLGVWQTGPASRQVSRDNPEWRREFAATLPDFVEDDICGSPFAICAYTVHEDFGGDAALAEIRRRLAARGVKLLVDFVPNHTALDHPWIATRPDLYIHGDDAILAAEPQNYKRVETPAGSLVLAHGRDPYFPGWVDTFQLNYRHRGLRDAMAGELVRISEMADGVRCDMAMLVLPEIFARTWGDRSLPRDGSAPVDEPFWPEAIAAVRARRPDFVFMAEVYWDLEYELQHQGFDYTYDKRLYDRLETRDAVGMRGHLHADLEFQRRSARFLENHDEPRAAANFPPGVHEAAAIVSFLVPGLRFFHEGQLDGRRVRVSMHLGRRPEEPVDESLREFYANLLECLSVRKELDDGSWRPVDCRPAWDGNDTWARFVAFAWEGHRAKLLVCVNFGPTQGQCYVTPPFDDLHDEHWRLRDLMGLDRYNRDGNELATRGLYLDMPAWGFHVFDVAPAWTGPLP